MVDLMEFVREDVQNKKSYPAKHDYKCAGCGNPILKNDPFYFFGPNKVDDNCLREILDLI